MQLNFVVRQGNSAITLSFVNPSPMGEGFQLLETLLQLHKLCSYIICSIKYTCTIYQFTQKIPHTRGKSPPVFSPSKTPVFRHPLCVDVVQCLSGTCYKSGKVGWLLNLYWWKKKRLIVYRIHIRSFKPPDPDYQELHVLECSRFVVPS